MRFKMLQALLSRSKAVKFLFVSLVFVFITVILLLNDTVLAKIYANPIPACSICSLNSSISFKNRTKIIRFPPYSPKFPTYTIDLVVVFSHVARNPNLKNKFCLCLSSLFKSATSSLHLHILSDDQSLNSAVEILKKTVLTASIPIQISLYDVNALLDPVRDIVNLARPYFSFKQGAYYSDALFFLSIGLFKVIPLEKVIIVDADVKFLNDITNLHGHFENFSKTAMIGIALEQQPVYRHVLHEYRHLSNESWIGGPPPDGFPGFNSGVLLMDLQKMRTSKLYNSFLNNSTLQSLITKYKFKGHLGDQDFYTLLRFEHPELFYTLPCSWNRQLCQWWKHRGYSQIFDLYHFCNITIHLLHGNCNSRIPDDSDAS